MFIYVRGQTTRNIKVKRRAWETSLFPGPFLNLHKRDQTAMSAKTKLEEEPTNPKTSPQPDRTATTAGSLFHR